MYRPKGAMLTEAWRVTMASRTDLLRRVDGLVAPGTSQWRPAEWCTGPGERVAVKTATVIG